MPTPLVSILMAAYNREQYIAEAIESVLAQTFTDFELIIVDDCSKDRTVEIAKRYTKDPRVTIHVNAKNLRQFPNRNRAAQLAQGRYIKYLDSDDVFYPFGLAVMVEMMVKHPSAALGMQRPPVKDRPYPILLSPEESYREHFLHGGLFGEGPSGTIILASAFHEVGGFRDTPVWGDVQLLLRLGARFPVLKFMRGLVWWRRHQAQEISTQSGTFPYGTAAYPVNRDALTAKECPLNVEECHRALRWCKHRQVRVLLRIALRDGRPGKAMRIMRETGISLRDLALAFAPVEKPGTV